MEKENIGSCSMCEDDEDLEISRDSVHVLCDICGLCRKYHCECDY